MNNSKDPADSGLPFDATGGIIYNVTVKLENRQAYERYIAEHANYFRKESFDKWGEKFIAFRTVMEVVN